MNKLDGMQYTLAFINYVNRYIKVICNVVSNYECMKSKVMYIFKDKIFHRSKFISYILNI